jgi:integrase
MPRLKEKPLTAMAVDKLKAKDKRYDEYDATVRGLGVRVAVSGTKTWFVMRRVNGRMVRASIGRYPAISLTAARKKAVDTLAQMEDGTLPRSGDADLFEQVFEEWLKRDQGENRRRRTVELALRKYACPAFKGMKVDTIRRADVLRLLDKIADRGAPIQANRVLAYLRRLFNWCIERDLISGSPVSGLKAPAREQSRERVLSHEEIQAILKGADEMGYPFGPMVKLLILTGQRLNEVATAPWSEFDFDNALWKLPGSRTKNGRAHVVHLSPASLGVMNGLPRLDGSDLLFTTTGTTPISGFSRAKKRLDRLSDTTDWTFHDLRRSFATHVTETLKCSPVVTDRILNHVSGSVKGVAAIYQRGEYLEERKQVLEEWGAFILDGFSETQGSATK